MSTHAKNRDRVATVLHWIVIGLAVGFIAWCAVWRLEGGRWERVETPSMGTVAPVGSLLWIKPANFASLRPGDFISFHPPGKPGVTFSHRVFAVNGDGTVSTKGVIPAQDPWRIGPQNLVGKVSQVWWGVGWIVTAAPLLLVGGLVVAAVRAVVNRDWKLPMTILLGSFVLTAAIVWYRPLLNAEQLSFVPSGNGEAVATYVGTGLLPVKLEASGGATGAKTGGTSIGSSVVMRDGQVGSVRVSNPDSHSALSVQLKAAVPWWIWALLIVVCFLPALYSLVVGFPPLPDEDEPIAA